MALVAVLVTSLRAQQGTFTYAIDDPAIHLTLARNLAHGTFGLVPGTYESASSSPVWVLLLAPFFVVANDAWWAPLLLNGLALGWLIKSFSGLPIIRRMVTQPVGVFGVLAIPIGLGWVPLVLIGMEHTLQAAVFVQLLIWLPARSIGQTTSRVTFAWYGLVAGAALLRFEMAFVAIGLAVALVSVTRASWRAASATLAAAGLPILAFAMINRSFGQYGLPNSVIAKTSLGDGLPIPRLDQVITRLTDDRLLLFLTTIALAVLILQLRRTEDSRPQSRLASAGLLAVLVTVVFHVGFADVGWFDRYQSYLVIALAFAILSVAADLKSPRFSTLPIAVGVLVLSLIRLNLLVSTPQAQYEIYEMQYQMGQFFSQAYDARAIAVGDIGYVSWFHRGELVDVAGLGSYDVLAARKERRWGPETTLEVFGQHDVEVLAVYAVYFPAGVVLPGWTEGARWCVADDRVVLSNQCVVFYAPAGAGVDRLRGEMKRYVNQVPPGVTVTIT